MPTYEYECKVCGHAFEVFTSMLDSGEKRCPVCKAKGKRLPGAGAGFIFKGKGFYSTDYRSESYKKDREKDKGPEKDKAPEKEKSPAKEKKSEKKNK